MDGQVLDPDGARERLAAWKGRIDKLAADTKVMSDRLQVLQETVGDPDDLNNLQMPNGNEVGANKYWIPGGYTSGGVPEATIDVPAGTPFTEIKLGS